jgi:hypothetical protein
VADQLKLGNDVTGSGFLTILDLAQIVPGTLVGVKRTDGSVTVGRVDPPCQDTLPGCIRVTLSADGLWKQVTPDLLFSIAGIYQQVVLINLNLLGTKCAN